MVVKYPKGLSDMVTILFSMIRLSVLRNDRTTAVTNTTVRYR